MGKIFWKIFQWLKHFVALWKAKSKGQNSWVDRAVASETSIQKLTSRPSVCLPFKCSFCSVNNFLLFVAFFFFAFLLLFFAVTQCTLINWSFYCVFEALLLAQAAKSCFSLLTILKTPILFSLTRIILLYLQTIASFK